MKRLIILIVTTCIGITLAGCQKDLSAQNTIEKTELTDSSIVNIKVENTTQLTEILEKTGYKIKATKQDNNGFLSGELTIINIDGDSIGVYEYDNSEEVEQEVKKIGSDGSKIADKIYNFKSNPHFYKNGSVIVSYFGDNKDTIKKIEDLIGKQFAGVV